MPVAPAAAKDKGVKVIADAFMAARHFPDEEPTDRDGTGWDAIIVDSRTVRQEPQLRATFPSHPEIQPQWYRVDQFDEVIYRDRGIDALARAEANEALALTASEGIFGVRPRFLDPPVQGDVDLSRLSDAEAKDLFLKPRADAGTWEGPQIAIYHCAGERGKEFGVDTLLAKEGIVCIMLENDPKKGGRGQR